MKKLLPFFLIPFLIACGGKQAEISVDENGNVDSSSFKYPEGEAVYLKTCIACHQAKGEGVAGAFPPLDNSDYLFADKERAISQIIKGSSGEMIVNGETYNNIMPPQELTDEEVKDVMNYILNAWGNDEGEVTLEDVKRVKG
mgnify:CR=1 FL=1